MAENPTGWRLVPVEPTPEMVATVDDMDSDKFVARGRAIDIWARFIAAAPLPRVPAPPPDPAPVASGEVERPSLCRNALRDAGKPYPRSGCAVCRNGGLVGCPYENRAQSTTPARALSREEVVNALAAVKQAWDDAPIFSKLDRREIDDLVEAVTGLVSRGAYTTGVDVHENGVGVTQRPDREAIARVIAGFGPPSDNCGPATRSIWNSGLTKADAIIALIGGE